MLCLKWKVQLSCYDSCCRYLTGMTRGPKVHEPVLDFSTWHVFGFILNQFVLHCSQSPTDKHDAPRKSAERPNETSHVCGANQCIKPSTAITPSRARDHLVTTQKPCSKRINRNQTHGDSCDAAKTLVADKDCPSRVQLHLRNIHVLNELHRHDHAES